jgi:hypothetical protein
MKVHMLSILRLARTLLDHGDVEAARNRLNYWECLMSTIPASTRRRWKCGR